MRNIICSIVLCFISLSVFAQSATIEIKRDTTYNAAKDTIVRIKYSGIAKRDTLYAPLKNTQSDVEKQKDIWFASFETGVQKYYGDDDNKNGYFSNLSTGFRISVGKWLYPFIALRGNLGYMTAKGYTLNPNAGYIESSVPNSKGLYKQKWAYMSAGSDLVFDIGNMVKYKPERKSKYLVFIGASYNLSRKNCDNKEAKSSAAFSSGLEYRYSISKHFRLSASMRMDVLNKSFDGEQTPKYFECSCGLNVGITWYMHRKIKKSNVGLEDRDKTITTNFYSKRINEIHQLAEKDTYEDFIHPVAVFFIINKYYVRPEYDKILEMVSKEIKRSQSKFILYGSADSATGNRRINRGLSDNRCKSVFKVLTEKYHVNPKQLIIESRGGVGIYQTKHLNRCVIIVEDNEKAKQDITKINNEKQF